MGTVNEFTPDLLVSIAMKGIFVCLFEVGLAKLGFYLLNVGNNISFLELAAYSGYKYIGVIITILASCLLGGNLVYYPTLIILSLCFVTFMLKSLRKSGLNQSDQRVRLDANTSKRNYFIFFLSLLQIPIYILMTYPYTRQILFYTIFGSNSSSSTTTTTPSSADEVDNNEKVEAPEPVPDIDDDLEPVVPPPVQE
jgi:hypothetical protein